MSRIYKKSNFAGTNASTGIAFGGGGGGGGGNGAARRSAQARREAAYGNSGGISKKAGCAIGATVSAAAISSSNPRAKAAGYVATAATAYICS